MAVQDDDGISEVKYFRHLCGIMQKTRGARFAGSQLLIMKERASLLVLALLSVFLIGLSVLLIADPSIADANRVRSIGVVSVVEIRQSWACGVCGLSLPSLPSCVSGGRSSLRWPFSSPVRPPSPASQ